MSQHRFGCVAPTSALPPSMDIVRSARQVRFVPITDVCFTAECVSGVLASELDG